MRINCIDKMKTYTLTSEGRTFEINGKLYKGVNLLFRGRIRPKAETPKTYKVVGGFICIERGLYESGLVTVYKTKGGKFAASLYKDGCFYPYYSCCELIEQ